MLIIRRFATLLARMATRVARALRPAPVAVPVAPAPAFPIDAAVGPAPVTAIGRDRRRPVAVRPRRVAPRAATRSGMRRRTTEQWRGRLRAHAPAPVPRIRALLTL